MNYFKTLLIIFLLSTPVLSTSVLLSSTANDITLSINEDKVLKAIEILSHVENATFEHQEDCEIKETNICTCDGDYLALIEYNRIIQAKQLLCDSIEIKKVNNDPKTRN